MERRLRVRVIKDATPLYFACQEGHLPVVTFLINKGANLEASEIDGSRPLHISASQGHLEVVKAMIAKGAGMNALLTNTGQSALGLARRKNHTTIVTYLRSLGAVDDGIGLPVVA